jgi:hypothetical protein
MKTTYVRVIAKLHCREALTTSQKPAQKSPIIIHRAISSNIVGGTCPASRGSATVQHIGGAPQSSCRAQA